jgi:hypothetical protein
MKTEQDTFDALVRIPIAEMQKILQRELLSIPVGWMGSKGRNRIASNTLSNYNWNMRAYKAAGGKL